MVGTGMLWVGWYGFNAGSAVAADGVAANAFATTTLAAAIAGAAWPAHRVAHARQAHGARLLLGCRRRSRRHHARRRLRDAHERGHHRRDRRCRPLPRLHQAQGPRSSTTTRSTPSACTASAARSARSSPGVFATPEVNANLNTNLAGIVGKTLWSSSSRPSGFTLVLSIVGTVVIAYVVKAVIGLRPTPRTKRRASTTRTTARPATTTTIYSGSLRPRFRRGPCSREGARRSRPVVATILATYRRTVSLDGAPVVFGGRPRWDAIVRRRLAVER